ncbi:MAG: DUF5104 domain-containing protein [Oscillospiraceae bacterium]|nr:DUF5104 domain-containing protein [Oscillospiraceae bacterium]
MKRIILILIVLVIGFNGCSNYISVDNEGKKSSTKLLNYLNDRDFDGLKSMFCETIQSLDDFDEQIQNAFDFFEGSITSFYSIKGINHCSGGSKRYDGEYTDVHISPH